MHFAYVYFVSVITLLPLIQCCNSFKEIVTEITPKHGKVFNTTVKGCISRVTLNITDYAKEMRIINQPLTALKSGAVENMASLTSIEFQRCRIQSIRPRSFRNVPNLETIFINNGLLEEINQDVFVNMPNLKKISLAHNKISTIENGSFDIPTLQILHVPYNQLRYWNKYWLSSFRDLVEIDLRDNLVSELTSNSFANFQNLSKIILNYNAITNIETNAFKGVRSLKYLGLSYNYLTTVDIEWFPHHLNLHKLTINANHLNYLSTKVLQRIKPKQIVLDGNPWICECWKRVLLWTQNSTGTIEATDCKNDNVPVCISGENPNKCVEAVNPTLTETFFREVRKSIEDIENVQKMNCYRFN